MFGLVFRVRFVLVVTPRRFENRQTPRRENLFESFGRHGPIKSSAQIPLHLGRATFRKLRITSRFLGTGISTGSPFLGRVFCLGSSFDMASKATGRTCLFCGGSPTTNEHVLPLWLRNMIAGPGEIPHEWGSYKTGEKHQWKAKQSEFKANVVCAPCNSGWMNDLETATQPHLKPMLRGHGKTLHHAGRELCTLWTLKTAMMLACVGPPDQRLFSEADYREFYESRQPPADLFVWIGATNARHGFFGEASEPTIGSARGVAQGRTVTFRLGYLVFHVLRIELKDRPPLEIGGQLGNALIRLWPSDEPVPWPPPVILSVEEAESVRKLIKGFN